MKIHDWYWEEIKSCIEYIDAEAYRGSSYKDIKIGLEQKLNTRLRAVRDACYVCMPYSLSRYIRRRLYTVKYMKWSKNPINLTETARFDGIKKYKSKFAHEFDLEIQEGLNEDDLQPKLDVDEIKQMYQKPSGMPVIKNYNVPRDVVLVEKDRKETLKQTIRYKAYFLPECLEWEFRQLDADSKMLYLIIATHAINNKSTNKQVTLNQLNTEMATIRFYDFRNCYLLNNGLLVFVPKLPASLYTEFCKCCEELLPDIQSVIPEGALLGKMKWEVDMISGSDTLKELKEAMGIDDPRPMVWQYLRWGYLRLRDNSHKAYYS